MASLRSYWRFIIVLRYFLPLIIGYLRDRRRFLIIGGSRAVSSETRRRRAEYLLDSLVALGPTFIKLGQLLSTRPDVLPPEYVEVFSRLQDDVPAADWAVVKQLIESDLGPIDEQFAEFDTDAISGASLGQVYRARIDDQEVAVKVRRPGVEELVASDLQVIQWSIPLLQRLVDDARAFSLENLADEFERTIREEMDYGREREVLEEIRGNFESNPEIVIPRSIESHCSDRVLTMEYIDGIKINDITALDQAGVDRTDVAERLAEAYLKMIVDDGVFHADPHPGNLAVKPDGRIVFYDFGMSNEVDPFIQEKIVEFYIAVANRDIDQILDVMVEMGTLSPNADRAVMAEVMELAIANARGEEIDQYRVQRIIQQVQDSIYEFPFRLPRELALIMRVGTITEGVCVTLDPQFDFIDTATGYLSAEGYREETIRQIASTLGSQLSDTATSAVQVLPKLEQTLDRMQRDNLLVRVDIEDSKGRLQRLTKRVVLGMLATAGVLSTSLLYAFSTVEATAIVAGGTVVVGWKLYRSFSSGGEGAEMQIEPEFGRQGFREYEDTQENSETTPGLPSEEFAGAKDDQQSESTTGR